MTRVSEMMTEHPYLVDSSTSLRDAAKKMKEFTCGSLIVGSNGTLEGIVTDRDIVVWGLAGNLDANVAPIKEIMASEVVTVEEGQTLEQAADIMSDADVRRLVVLDKAGKVVGLLSVSDIVKCPDADYVNDNILHHLYRYA